MAKRLGDLFSNVDEVLNNAKISNFEEVFSRTKTFTEEVSKKSAEKLELSRKKVECLDIKAKLCKAYEKFGRMQYEAYIGLEKNESDVSMVAGEIATLKERLAALTAELNAVKTTGTEVDSSPADDKPSDVDSKE